MIVEQWLRVAMNQIGDYATASGFKGLGDMAAISPTLHDMMGPRKKCIGAVCGLYKIPLESASAGQHSSQISSYRMSFLVTTQ